jgi:hypothetical protein
MCRRREKVLCLKCNNCKQGRENFIGKGCFSRGKAGAKALRQERCLLYRGSIARKQVGLKYSKGRRKGSR